MKTIIRKSLSLLFYCAALLFMLHPAQAASLKKTIRLNGKTMGTFYSITCYVSRPVTSESLKPLVDKQLQMINQSMSMYSKSSELSRFNRLGPDDVFSGSEGFIHVLKIGQDLYNETLGAWDGTVKPLVDLWGFGTKKQAEQIPSRETVTGLLSSTGFDTIRIEGSTVRKSRPGITLDLGSIAKGYGVDSVARLLHSMKIDDFLVEIGGEVITSGSKPNGTSWTVGISRPDKTGIVQPLYKIVRLAGKAMATSGDYRNFYRLEGREFSHIIDPSTGYPVTNGVVSVSVISDTCTFADGLATALMVMGPDAGIKLVNELTGTECLIVVRDKEKKLTDYESEGFHGYVLEP